jgi:hypothetical protein
MASFFWGISPSSTKVFKLQKKVIRIRTNARSRDSCRDMFKELKMLPFYSQYIYSLLTSVLNNSELFITNSMISNINTRQKKKQLSSSTFEINNLSERSSLHGFQDF